MTKLQPLKNIKILDFSRLLPGPFLTKILCDLGAEVLKIEFEQKMDEMKSFPPFVWQQTGLLDVYLNKNKSRLKLDLNCPEHLQLIYQLIEKADVVVESFRPHAMKSFGLGYSKLKSIQKKLIYASLTGYGQKGEWAKFAGHDLNFMAASGQLAHFLPDVPHFQFADLIGGGVMGALQILAALLEREQTKRGRHLDLSMVRNFTYLNQHYFCAYPMSLNLNFLEGASLRYQIYLTKDQKWVSFAALEDKFWHRFCDAVKKPEWKKNHYLGKQSATLKKGLRELFRSRTARQWEQFAKQHDVCLMVVKEAKELRKSEGVERIEVQSEKQKKLFYETNLFGLKKKQHYFRDSQPKDVILKKWGLMI